MRTSTRNPYNRSSGYGSGQAFPGGGPAPAGMQGQILSPSTTIKSPGASHAPGSRGYNKGGGWNYGAASLEDRIARSLGFEGKHDGAFQAAKRMMRKAKALKGQLGFIIDAAEELIRMADQPSPLEDETGRTGPSFGTFSCNYSNTGRKPGVFGYLSAAGPFCAQGQASAGTATIPAGGTVVAEMGQNTNTTFPPTSFQIDRWFPQRPGLAGRRVGAFGPDSVHKPSPLNALDPLTMPIMKNVLASPMARPYGVPGLSLPTRESSASSYGSSATATTVASAQGQTGYRDIAITATKTGSVSVQLVPRTRVKTGTRERKAAVRMPAVVASAMNAVTETGDFMDAFYEALPERIRNREMAKRHGKPPKMLDKAALLYRHWYEVDLSAAMWNLAVNEAQDQAIGRLGSATKRATGQAAQRGYWRRIVGPGTGPAL